MHALDELLDELRVEGVEVVGLAAADQALLDSLVSDEDRDSPALQLV
jgi:hypothetical protein